jgi:ankyrin repeat protein
MTSSSLTTLRYKKGGTIFSLILEIPTIKNDMDIENVEFVRNGYILLHQASKNGDVEMAKFLIRRGVDVNQRGFFLQFSAIHFAALSASFSAVLRPPSPSIPKSNGIIVPVSIWGNFTG